MKKNEILNVLKPQNYYVQRHSGDWRIYEGIKKLMKKWCQKGPKIDAKINILVIRGPTLEVLGHVFLKTVFLWFLRHRKIDQKSKKSGPKSKRGGQGCPKSKVWADLGSALRNVRGRRGGDYEGGASNMMRFDEWILTLWNLIRHAEHPGWARGGGYIECGQRPRHRRPWVFCCLVYLLSVGLTTTWESARTTSQSALRTKTYREHGMCPERPDVKKTVYTLVCIHFIINGWP